jgi:hypothetical protein
MLLALVETRLARRADHVDEDWIVRDAFVSPLLALVQAHDAVA